MSVYDEIEIEDMTWDATLGIYHYPCPCGDRFEVGLTDLRKGDDIAMCPSCSLTIRVIYEVVSSPGKLLTPLAACRSHRLTLGITGGATKAGRESSKREDAGAGTRCGLSVQHD